MANILIVDDTSFMRGSLKYISENAGHKVVGLAKDGREAVDLYRKLKPDVVTMDILMKDADGLWALEEIRKDDAGARVIMVTALGQDEKREQAEDLGAVGYITKPFKHDMIVSELSRVLAVEA